MRLLPLGFFEEVAFGDGSKGGLLAASFKSINGNNAVMVVRFCIECNSLCEDDSSFDRALPNKTQQIKVEVIAFVDCRGLQNRGSKLFTGKHPKISIFELPAASLAA